MKEIQLTQGKIALVDDADYEWLSQHKWTALKRCVSGNPYCAMRGIRLGKRNYGRQYMHRAIMAAPAGLDVDHVNLNQLDNRRSNLRICTRSENLCNRLKRGDSTNKFKGVVRNHRRWTARCSGRYIGTFDTEEEAALAYDAVARQHHGGFARINFPIGNEVSRAV